MQPRLIDRVKTRKAILIAAVAGAAAYAFMPSCMGFVPDEDDTLCHAIAAAENGVVDWPTDELDEWKCEYRYCPDKLDRIAFDAVSQSPWYGDEAACRYLDGFLAGGEGWAEMGYEDPMSFDEDTGLIDTPIGRTYNGYANLVYSHGRDIDLDHSRSPYDWDYFESFLEWAAAYVHRNTFRVNANCRRDCLENGDCSIARTVTGTSWRNDYIMLYQTFFYDIDAIWRASTLFHEVRHARDGMLHTGGNSCSREASCDRRWSEAGANTYEALWLGAYAHTSSQHEFISPARRSRAETRLSFMIDETFSERPGRWNKETFVGINFAPEFYVFEMACSEDPMKPERCLLLAD